MCKHERACVLHSKSRLRRYMYELFIWLVGCNVAREVRNGSKRKRCWKLEGSRAWDAVGGKQGLGRGWRGSDWLEGGEGMFVREGKCGRVRQRRVNVVLGNWGTGAQRRGCGK